VNKSIKKALALAVILAALVAVYFGIGFVSNYEQEVKTYTLFSQGQLWFNLWVIVASV
jgi:hypothetical protein